VETWLDLVAIGGQADESQAVRKELGRGDNQPLMANRKNRAGEYADETARFDQV